MAKRAHVKRAAELIDEVGAAAHELGAAREASGVAAERLQQAERRFDDAMGAARREIVGPPPFRPRR